MKYIKLSPVPSKFTVNLDSNVFVFETKFNYSASMWTLNILDVEETAILTGLMLKPNIDILTPYPQQKKTMGSLVLIEKNVGDHLSPDLLGISTILLYYSPGEAVTIP